MALQRLQNTEKRLQKSPEIAQAFSDIIVAKGYVKKVPKSEQSTSKWYLPHFPVIRPEKDTTKTRIVFDASATCEDISLNDVKHIRIPRCLWKNGMVADTMSFHTFVDASESAYGAVVYARCQYEECSVSTNIVAAKTRVSAEHRC